MFHYRDGGGVVEDSHGTVSVGGERTIVVDNNKGLSTLDEENNANTTDEVNDKIITGTADEDKDILKLGALSLKEDNKDTEMINTVKEDNNCIEIINTVKNENAKVNEDKTNSFNKDIDTQPQDTLNKTTLHTKKSQTPPKTSQQP